jgi:hypothetical protein
MKKFLPGLLLGLVLGAAGAWLLLPSRKAGAESGEKPAATEEPAKSAAGLHLSKEQLASAGLELASPTTATLTPQVEAFGRVLDPTPLVTAAAEVVSAQAAFTASQKEFDRVKKLHEEGNNASTQALETAEAAAQRDRVQHQAARARFAAAWGQALLQRLDSGLIEEAIEKGWAFARIDVPPGSAGVGPSPATAEVSLLTGEAKPFSAEVIGLAPNADPQLQGKGYLVLLRDQALPAGAALRASLAGEGQAEQRPVVPRSALVRHEGSVFVFVQTTPDTFQRRLIELGRPLADGVAVLSGLNENDRIVVKGAQQLLSTELGAASSAD